MQLKFFILKNPQYLYSQKVFLLLGYLKNYYLWFSFINWL